MRMVAKKNKPIIVRRRPDAFIEGESLTASAPVSRSRSRANLDADTDEGTEDEVGDTPMSELTAEKMLLKLRMSNSRQLPVWSEAKDTLWEKGFEASAKAAEAVEAAQIRFRKILDAEAKIRDAELARAELSRLVAKTDPGDEDDGKDEESSKSEEWT